MDFLQRGEEFDERVSHHQTRAAEVVERLEGHPGRLLAVETRLGVEALTKTDAGEGELAACLREPAPGFSLRRRLHGSPRPPGERAR